MFVEIWFQSDEPPTGVVKVEGDPPVRFNGWLGLLQTVSHALQETPPAERAATLSVAH
jgi:hypothetical protein